MSKITSKIQFSSETRTDVIFGGGIGFDYKSGVIQSDKTGDKAVAVKLALYQLCYPAAVGEPLKDDDVMNPRSPQVNLIFTDPRSIDAVIKALELTKEGLEASIAANRKERNQRRRDRRRNGRSGK